MSEFTEEELTLASVKYEYLDHTADVQLHSWGDSLKEAFEQCGIAMFGYMTELDKVEIKQCSEIEATGHDIESLLFHFLDELLFLFSCEPFLICSKLSITEFITEGEELSIRCNCYGEEFTLGKHPQGTEVKAITYSAMQIVNNPEQNSFSWLVGARSIVGIEQKVTESQHLLRRSNMTMFTLKRTSLSTNSMNQRSK